GDFFFAVELVAVVTVERDDARQWASRICRAKDPRAGSRAVANRPADFFAEQAVAGPRTVDLDVSGNSRLVGKTEHLADVRAGLVGLGVGQPVARGIIEGSLKPLLIGQDPLCIEKLWDDMFWRVRGYGRKGVAFCAISALDIGLWDLKAKIFDVPLYRLLGPYTDRVPIYGSGGWTSFSEKELVREQTGYVERGIPRVKMKVAKDFGRAEREDIRRLAAVRKAVGDDVEIYVDEIGRAHV